MKNKSGIKYFLLLLVGLCVFGGIYIYANLMYFLPIMWIYSSLSVVGTCIYIYLNMRYGDDEQHKHQKKLTVAIFLPFIIVLLFDFTYLLLLADNPMFIKIRNFLF